MKLITVMIQPHKLPDIKKALFDAQVTKMTVTNALGAGAQSGYTETYRGIKEEIKLLKKVRIEIAVNDDYVETTIKAIINGAKTGYTGDGKIFVQDLTECVRIRTEERGTKAIG